MSTFNFRILLETLEGYQTSYASSSFVDTDVDLVLSASQVWHRITGSVSCSYHNDFVGTSSISIYNGSNPTFKDNLYLSSSLSGSEDLGTIEFKLKETEYDRLKRYKFFGSKVCTVLGLPENLWIYPDEFRLTDESQQNYFEGDVKAETLTVNNSFNVSNVGNVTSDFPFNITKESDRYIRFIENVSGSIPFNAVMLGYDVGRDIYELTGSNDATFNISGVNEIQATSLNVTSITSSYTTSSVEQIFTQITSSGNSLFGDANTDNHRFLGNVGIQGADASSISHSVDGLTVAGDISASGDLYIQSDSYINFAGENNTNTSIRETGGNLNIIADGHLNVYPDHDFKIHRINIKKSL